MHKRRAPQSLHTVTCLIFNVPSRVDITNPARLDFDVERFAPYDGLHLFGKIKKHTPNSIFSSVGCLPDGRGVMHHLGDGGGPGCDVPCQPFLVAEFIPGGPVHFDAIGRAGLHQCCLNVAKHSLRTGDGQHHATQSPQKFPPSFPRDSSLALHLLQHSCQSRDSVLWEVDSSTD